MDKRRTYNKNVSVLNHLQGAGSGEYSSKIKDVKILEKEQKISGREKCKAIDVLEHKKCRP